MFNHHLINLNSKGKNAMEQTAKQINGNGDMMNKVISCYQNLNNHPDYEDARQAAVLRILEQINDGKKIDNIQAAVNRSFACAIMDQKKNHYVARRDNPAPDHNSEFHDMSAKKRHIAKDGSSIQYRHIKDSIQYCLSLLPIQRHKMVFKSLFVDDKTISECAIELKKSVITIKRDKESILHLLRNDPNIKDALRKPTWNEKLIPSGKHINEPCKPVIYHKQNRATSEFIDLCGNVLKPVDHEPLSPVPCPVLNELNRKTIELFQGVDPEYTPKKPSLKTTVKYYWQNSKIIESNVSGHAKNGYRRKAIDKHGNDITFYNDGLIPVCEKIFYPSPSYLINVKTGYMTFFLPVYSMPWLLEKHGHEITKRYDLTDYRIQKMYAYNQDQIDRQDMKTGYLPDELETLRYKRLQLRQWQQKAIDLRIALNK